MKISFLSEIRRGASPRWRALILIIFIVSPFFINYYGLERRGYSFCLSSLSISRPGQKINEAKKTVVNSYLRHGVSREVMADLQSDLSKEDCCRVTKGGGDFPTIGVIASIVSDKTFLVNVGHRQFDETHYLETQQPISHVWLNSCGK